MEDVLSSSLSYGDELWHVVLYQWLIDNGLTERLLEVSSIFVYLLIIPRVLAFSLFFNHSPFVSWEKSDTKS